MFDLSAEMICKFAYVEEARKYNGIDIEPGIHWTGSSQNYGGILTDGTENDKGELLVFSFKSGKPIPHWVPIDKEHVQIYSFVPDHIELPHFIEVVGCKRAKWSDYFDEVASENIMQAIREHDMQYQEYNSCGIKVVRIKATKENREIINKIKTS